MPGNTLTEWGLLTHENKWTKKGLQNLASRLQKKLKEKANINFDYQVLDSSNITSKKIIDATKDGKKHFFFLQNRDYHSFLIIVEGENAAVLSSMGASKLNEINSELFTLSKTQGITLYVNNTQTQHDGNSCATFAIKTAEFFAINSLTNYIAENSQDSSVSIPKKSLLYLKIQQWANTQQNGSEPYLKAQTILELLEGKKICSSIEKSKVSRFLYEYNLMSFGDCADPMIAGHNQACFNNIQVTCKVVKDPNQVPFGVMRQTVSQLSPENEARLREKGKIRTSPAGNEQNYYIADKCEKWIKKIEREISHDQQQVTTI